MRLSLSPSILLTLFGRSHARFVALPVLPSVENPIELSVVLEALHFVYFLLYVRVYESFNLLRWQLVRGP